MERAVVDVDVLGDELALASSSAEVLGVCIIVSSTGVGSAGGFTKIFGITV